jgi:hypothetical protein
MLRFFLLAALLAVSSPSNADSCIRKPDPLTRTRVTGPTKLAAASRSGFMKALNLEYELEPHGLRLQAAAKQTGVDSLSVKVPDSAKLRAQLDDVLWLIDCDDPTPMIF